MQRWKTLALPLFIATCFLYLFGIPGSGSSGEMPIYNKEYKSRKKPPVPFDHDTHAFDYGFACDECHHIYKMGRNVWEEGDEVRRCMECHDPKEKKGRVMKLQVAFHRNCQGCHKQSAPGEAPFRACYGCHVK
ncbi:MAG: cytochrome c3 family protein [Deltaproteobacteria bacterium]|nr:cytochrome c3 family protein [Deltaproteobacteria bacterium]